MIASGNVNKNESIYGQYIHEKKIFRDEGCLDKGYRPDIKDILHRGKEIEIIIRSLSKSLENITPRNMLIYGKMGTGKTMVINGLTEQLEKEAPQYNVKVKTVYVFCKSIPTNVGVFKIINDSLESDINNNRTKTTNSFDAYFKKFCKLANEYQGHIIIILDEIDKLNDPDVINLFARIKESGFVNRNVTIIGITNDIQFDENLDPRTKSIFGQRDVIFPPYNANQLRDILEQRTHCAFMPGVLEDTVIPLCAAYAAQEHGDARKAIELLMYSGNIAEEKNSDKVTENHVKLAKERIECDKTTEIIKTLPTQSKLVLCACMSEAFTKQKTYTGEVYAVYKQITKTLGLECLAQRRFTDLLSELSVMGLLNAFEISKGRYGRTKEVSPQVSIKQAWDTLMEDYRLAPLDKKKSYGNTKQNVLGQVF